MRLKPHGTYFRCVNINSRYSQIPLHEDIEELFTVFLSVGKFVFMLYLKGKFLFQIFLISIMASRSKTWRESKKTWMNSWHLLDEMEGRIIRLLRVCTKKTLKL